MISSTTQKDDDQVPLQELRFKTLKRRWYMLLVCGLMGTLQVCMCFVYLIILKKEKNGLPHIPFSTFIIYHISFELE